METRTEVELTALCLAEINSRIDRAKTSLRVVRAPELGDDPGHWQIADVQPPIKAAEWEKVKDVLADLRKRYGLAETILPVWRD